MNWYVWLAKARPDFRIRNTMLFSHKVSVIYQAQTESTHCDPISFGLTHGGTIYIMIALSYLHISTVDNKPAMVQVMAWRLPTTSHYRNQCWPSSLTHICGKGEKWVNSMNPGRFSSNFKGIILKLIIQKRNMSSHYEVALRQVLDDLTNETSTLVQVMAWCRQATSYYLSQCWPRSL